MATLSGRWPFQVPDDDFPLKPLRNVFSFLAQGIRDGLNSQKVPSAATSRDDRNAKFPDPTHGDRCFRVDLGYEETYFGAYNATSNPGGASPAGWYPSPGAPIYARVEKQNGFQTIGTGGGTTVSGLGLMVESGGFTLSGTTGRLRVPRSGMYSCQTRVYGSGSSLSGVNMGLNKSGSGIDTEAGAVARLKRTDGSVDEVETGVDIFRYAEGDSLLMFGVSLSAPASIYGAPGAPHSSTGFNLQYIGPLR